MPQTSLSRVLGGHIVREKEAHDLSRNPEFASFQFLGYRTSAVAVELVALCDADGLAEGDIVRLRDEFFGLVRRLPHDYGLKPRGRNPNGLLGFVFADGCPEPLARFIGRQTRISHDAGTGGVSVAWAIDVPDRRIHTHDNPVSIFPPVIVPARTVYPGLEFMESLLDRIVPADVPAAGSGSDGGGAHAHDLFVCHAGEDERVAMAIVRELRSRGLRVWDRTALMPGDSLRETIERGLAGSRYGLVLLSRGFFRNPSAQRELNGLFARETSEGRNLILPVWHEIDEREITRYAPILADKFALRTSAGLPFIADKLVQVLGNSPSPSHPPVAPRMEKILFFAANSATDPLDVEWEYRRIDHDLRIAKERDRMELKPVFAATIDSMMQAMLDEAPTIVHFSGHGTTEGIVLRSEAGNPQLVSGEALAKMFSLFRDSVRCVVLNSCWSEPQAQAIRRHIDHVIGTRSVIDDDAALAFSLGFYKAIGAGKDVPFAYELGLARALADGSNIDELVALL